ncbi:MAG: alpha-galactosidase [Gemmatimonadales bacterium]
MDRRTFVLLSGAASAALWRPFHLSASGARTPAAGSLRFDLDEQRRWSLWYHGAAQPVPLLRNATLGVWVGETLATLADLEDISVGNRRPPGGESLVIRGRAPVPPETGAAGVWIEAEFAAWDPSPAASAQGSITVTVYPDRVLATIRGVRFFAAPEAQVLPGEGPLLALVNGYQSWSPCSVATVPADLTSYAALGLTRQKHGLGIVFDPGEPGEARVKLASDAGGGLDAVTEWTPARPVRPEGDAATLRLAYLPDGDGFAALSAVAMPTSSVDRERVAALAAPTGWCSWYELGADVTETDVLANLEFCATHFDRRFLRYVQIDDGYQRAAGDWEANSKFPHGHRWLTDRIHASGFQAGLWIAPFAVAEQSGMPAANPAWLLKSAGPESAPLVVDTRESWGGRVFALDGAHPGVQQWLYDLARRVVRDWGYDYVKVDFLHWATAGAGGGGGHYGGLTHAEAYRRGLAAIRDGLGTETFLLGCGAPLQHAAGLVNGMRIGEDVGASWGGIQAPARAAALRSFYHRSVWLNDPDCLVVRPPLTLDEARVWASIVAVSGGMNILSDNLPKLPTERLPLIQKTLPVAGIAGRPVGTQVEESALAPGLVAGDTVVHFRGPWRFRTGDDPRYAARDYDDDAWETIPVPLRWEQSGHADYDGDAWYRTRFTLPVLPTGRSDGRTDGRSVWIELGKVDDVDETFVNGVKVGGTSGWRAYRRYSIPADALNWGGENVLAMHVTDSGGPGGLWSVRRDRPAATWVVEGASRWWTVVLVNWEDEPQTISRIVAGLGIPGSRFGAYDVWAERPLADVQQTLTATIAPHRTLTVALRAAAARPQVIGTTRHVIQGTIDIAEERWVGATRTLSVKSVNLDGRPYAVTVAVPRGLRPGVCKANVPCTVRRLESGHVLIEWPAGNANDLSWSLSFRQAARR